MRGNNLLFKIAIIGFIIFVIGFIAGRVSLNNYVDKLIGEKSELRLDVIEKSALCETYRDLAIGSGLVVIESPRCK